MMASALALVSPPVDWTTIRGDLTVQQHLAFEAEFRRTEKPRLRDVLHAEQVISRFRCIGPTDRWHRTFSFSRNPATLRLDTSLIEFGYKESQHRLRPAGREITTLENFITGTDDSEYKLAGGVYSIRTGLATLTYCGMN